MTRSRTILLAGVMATTLFSVVAAQAQPESGRVFSGATATMQNDCSVVTIGFNLPVRYTSYFPLTSGSQLTIRLTPIGDTNAFLGRDSVAVPQAAAAMITDLEYDGGAAGGPTLTVVFDQTAYYRIDQSPDFLSIKITVSGTPDLGHCTASQGNGIAAPAGEAPHRGAGAVLPPNPTRQKILDNARVALTAKQYRKAIALLTTFLQGPDNAEMPTARELLGVARERNGQDAQAKAEYETYLRNYSDSPGAGRVRQRLASMLAHALHHEIARTPGATPSSLNWNANASISEYFYHDEMSTVVHDQNAQITVDSGLTSLQTQLVSALNTTVSVTGEDFKAQFRASGSYTQDFLNNANNRTSLGELYLDVADISGRYSLRAGRQYRSTGGVLGRIDGGLVSLHFADHYVVNLLAGFPVDSSYSGINTKRIAYGLSAGYADGGFNGDIYALRQTDGSFVDRQSVGTDARYVNKSFAAFATLDYDLHFNQINIALLNGNFILSDQSTINLSVDYRRAPLLRTSDALIGQQVTALSDLLSTYTRAQIQQLALDRTATSLSLFASVTHPLNQHYSVGLDATLWQMSGMPASAGVPAMPASGSQYYLSGHFTGTGLLTEGDVAMMSAGYSKTSNSSRYTFDLNTRYPVLRTLRAGPRLFLSYRSIIASSISNLSGTQVTVRPTLRVNYRVDRNLTFEIDGGAEWMHEKLNTTTTQTWNYLVNFGITANF